MYLRTSWSLFLQILKEATGNERLEPSMELLHFRRPPSAVSQLAAGTLNFLPSYLKTCQRSEPLGFLKMPNCTGGACIRGVQGEHFWELLPGGKRVWGFRLSRNVLQFRRGG